MPIGSLDITAGIGQSALADAATIGHGRRRTSDLTSALVDLPVASFVEVLQRTFDVRTGDIEVRHFDRKYVLAVCSLLLSSDGTATTDDMQVEYVPRPVGPPMFDSLSQAGGCANCGREVTSTNKIASSAICGTQVGLS